MRVAILAVFCGVGAPVVAQADPLPRPIVWQNRVVDRPATTKETSQLTSVSRKLYLNDCKPNGCTVSPGNDNSLTNRSSIPVTTVTLSAYNHPQAHWDLLVQCVKDTFAPFAIEVLTQNPGSTTAHFEVMIGGGSRQLHPQLDAGGVAPFISCNATRDNIISFVFPQTTDDLEFLCGAVVQEAAHVWGLDHELNAKDPLTYLELGSLKRFQNDDANCGEDLGAERSCECGGTTQNSFRYMTNTFGLAAGLAAPVAKLVTPRANAWLKPGFPISGLMISPLETLKATFKIDGVTASTLQMGPFAVNAPATIAAGDHKVSVEFFDAGDRVASETVDVHVMSSCADGQKCASKFHCLGGTCLPGSGVAGGLGASCTENDECATGSCGTDGSESRCTASCDAGATCPSGYDCLGAENGSGGVCWPNEGGGCSTHGSSAGFLMTGLGVLLLAMRRRR